jgi:hypothetical protein
MLNNAKTIRAGKQAGKYGNEEGTGWYRMGKGGRENSFSLGAHLWSTQSAIRIQNPQRTSFLFILFYLFF